MVPASLTTILSASASVVLVAEVDPSMMFNSAVVAVTPSSLLISAVVAVTPSRMFNSAAVDVIADPPRVMPVVVMAPRIRSAAA